MPLFEGNQQQYYGQEQFTTTANQASGSGHADEGDYVLTFPVNQTLMNSQATMPTSSGEINVDTIVSGTTTLAVPFTYNAANYTVTLTTPVAQGATVIVNIIEPKLGNYQYITIQQLINNFIIQYVGEGKLLSKCRRSDVAFHAQRGLQEFSYDTLRSTKSAEIEIPPALKMALPHDYVNYVKLTWMDNSGIERTIYPATKTSNPTAYLQDDDYNYTYDSDGNVLQASDSDTWTNFNDNVGGGEARQLGDDYIDNWFAGGGRYGLEPSRAHNNGVYYIDQVQGNIHFSSDLSGKTVTLKYISDGLGTEDDMVVHKFAEEAMYKWIAYAVLSTKVGIPEYIVARYKKDRFSSMRNAKLRLSNLKSEELTAQMRNKSKQIKH